jgi:hypothetical protein
MKEIPNKESIWSLSNDKLKQEPYSRELSGSITNYNAKSEFTIAGRGKVFIIELEEAMLGSDFIEKFKGKVVGINDKLWTVKGVELPAVNREFLIVALLVN